MGERNGLNAQEKRERFAAEYVKCESAEKAALAAGYSKTYARHSAYKLLKNEYVMSEIRRIREENGLIHSVTYDVSDVLRRGSAAKFTDRILQARGFCLSRQFPPVEVPDFPDQLRSQPPLNDRVVAFLFQRPSPCSSHLRTHGVSLVTF